ncbi:2-C-methyl-D-erythritol 4-phosphate cytidylyltransferase [Aliikangiella maris]|uniref:2-C-methyl-D-erythritol 4-phosphate cytidylyltransferase n=2 Tax=Aliikangiella maris TaxID=3162458 RepID=A0ABV3MLZ9_9GAMM
MPRDLSKLKGCVAVIPAAGVGKRMQSKLPKQYLKIKDRSILGITLDKFLSFSPVKLIVLVVSSHDTLYKNLREIENEKIIIIDGGDERIHSVYNALCYLYDNGLADKTPVMVHDAVRPCVSHQDLQKLLDAFKSSQQPCLLTAPVVDTLQSVNADQQIESLVDRSKIVRALTPQMAQFIQLKKSIESVIDNKTLITDEVSALCLNGYQVNAVTGQSDNIKITHPDDLALAEFYLEQQI